MFKFLLLSVASATFSDYLTGQKPITSEVFETLWNDFSSAHPSTRIYFHRKNNFANNLESIIEHNSKPGVTYQKGINPYSDLSEQEFRDHFMLKQGQNCSATAT